MDHLDQLENKSVHSLREAYANFKQLAQDKDDGGGLETLRQDGYM